MAAGFGSLGDHGIATAGLEPTCFGDARCRGQDRDTLLFESGDQLFIGQPAKLSADVWGVADHSRDVRLILRRRRIADNGERCEQTRDHAGTLIAFMHRLEWNTCSPLIPPSP